MLSTSALLLFLSLLPQQDGAANLGMLLVAAGLSGSTLYAIGAAAWRGMTACRLRRAGWVLTAVAFGIPSTLSLAMPVVGLLAFPLSSISRHAGRRAHTGSAPA